MWHTIVKKLKVVVGNLQGKQNQESNHQAEKAHSLGQGESQDSVREQLLFQLGVASITNDQWAEDCSNTSSRSSDSNSGGTSTNEFSGRLNIIHLSGCLKWANKCLLAVKVDQLWCCCCNKARLHLCQRPACHHCPGEGECCSWKLVHVEYGCELVGTL